MWRGTWVGLFVILYPTGCIALGRGDGHVLVMIRFCLVLNFPKIINSFFLINPVWNSPKVDVKNEAKFMVTYFCAPFVLVIFSSNGRHSEIAMPTCWHNYVDMQDNCNMFRMIRNLKKKTNIAIKSLKFQHARCNLFMLTYYLIRLTCKKNILTCQNATFYVEKACWYQKMHVDINYLHVIIFI